MFNRSGRKRRRGKPEFRQSFLNKIGGADVHGLCAIGAKTSKRLLHLFRQNDLEKRLFLLFQATTPSTLSFTQLD
jgi:hypothetical protein